MGKAVRRGVVVLMLVLLGATIARASAAAAAASTPTIRGRVLAADGTPAAGARVWTIRYETQAPERREVRADADGRFAIEAATGSWLVEATLGDQGVTQDPYLVVEGRDPEPTTIQLKPQSRLRGRLIEAETGRPIAGGRFFLDNGEVPVSDADGRFEVAGLHRSAAHKAFAVAPGRERRRVVFEMADGPTTDLEVAVGRGSKAVGLVLDPDGRPVAGAWVGKSTGGDPVALNALWTRTDERGRFVYDGLRPGQTTWFNVNAPGFIAAQRLNVRPGPRGEPVALFFRLDREPPSEMAPDEAHAAEAINVRKVSGVVLDPAGNPVADVPVRWGMDATPEAPRTTTDAAGRFVLAPVPADADFLCVLPPHLDLAVATVRVEGDGDREVPVTLVPSRTASGVIRDARGTPLEGVKVTPTLNNEQQQWSLDLTERTVTTDAQGRFVLKGLPADIVHASFAGDGLDDLDDQALTSDDRNTPIMVPTGVIRGRVVDAAGRPVRNFRVLLGASRQPMPADTAPNLDDEVSGFGLSVTAADGSFTIRHLLTDSVQRVAVLAPGHGAGVVDRVITEPHTHLAPDRVVTIRLGPPSALVVRVFDEESRAPIPEARVSLIADDPTENQATRWGYADTNWCDSVHATTDRAGEVAFSCLSFDEGSVLVEAPGYPDQRFGWSKGTRDLNLFVKPEAMLAGELLDKATGLPLEGVAVSVSSSTFGSFGETVAIGSGGRFRIGALPEGNYTFTVTAGGNVTLHEEVIDLKAGEQPRRTLRLTWPDEPEFPEVPAEKDPTEDDPGELPGVRPQ